MKTTMMTNSMTGLLELAERIWVEAAIDSKPSIASTRFLTLGSTATQSQGGRMTMVIDLSRFIHPSTKRSICDIQWHLDLSERTPSTALT